MSIHHPKLLKSTNSAILSTTTPLVANVARFNYFIQNCGMNPLFVKEGTGASTTDFTLILSAGSGNDNGTGGSVSSSAEGVYPGAITIAGTSPRYVITERAENI